MSLHAAEVVVTPSNKDITKKSNPIISRAAALETIQHYPKDWINVFTDGSAFKTVIIVGYGVWIQYPDGTYKELFDSCDSFCSNFEAEYTALNTALFQISVTFTAFPTKIQNIVVFTDSLSAFEATESGKGKNPLTVGNRKEQTSWPLPSQNYKKKTK